jgi:hypothetical protein
MKGCFTLHFFLNVLNDYTRMPEKWTFFPGTLGVPFSKREQLILFIHTKFKINDIHMDIC